MRKWNLNLFFFSICTFWETSTVLEIERILQAPSILQRRYSSFFVWLMSKHLKSTESATRCHLKWLFPCSAGILYSCCYFLIVLSYAFKLLFLFSLYLLNPKADPFCSTAQHHNITRRTSVFCSHSRFHFFWLFYLTGAISNWRKFSTSFKFFRLPTSTKLSYLQEGAQLSNSSC